MVPIGLMSIDSALEYGFEDFVNSFDLTIPLRVVSRGELVLELKESG